VREGRKIIGGEEKTNGRMERKMKIERNRG
jgi:hypothetical protein